MPKALKGRFLGLLLFKKSQELGYVISITEVVKEIGVDYSFFYQYLTGLTSGKNNQIDAEKIANYFNFSIFVLEKEIAEDYLKTVKEKYEARETG